ncbi:unnamed protein product [Brassica oleracea var. botrytis]
MTPCSRPFFSALLHKPDNTSLQRMKNKLIYHIELFLGEKLWRYIHYRE